MKIYFVTSSQDKFQEAKKIIKDLEQVKLDLLEIQEVTPEKIVEHKLKEAIKHHKTPLVVDDVSLEIDVLNGFPGPYTKWMEKTMGVEGVYELVEKLGNPKVTVKTIVGLALDDKNIQYFVGEVKGKLVSSKGNKGYGFDVTFIPDGHTKTYFEMELDEKNLVSHRGKAFRLLKEYLDGL